MEALAGLEWKLHRERHLLAFFHLLLPFLPVPHTHTPCQEQVWGKEADWRMVVGAGSKTMALSLGHAAGRALENLPQKAWLSVHLEQEPPNLMALQSSVRPGEAKMHMEIKLNGIIRIWIGVHSTVCPLPCLVLLGICVTQATECAFHMKICRGRKVITSDSLHSPAQHFCVLSFQPVSLPLSSNRDKIARDSTVGFQSW